MASPDREDRGRQSLKRSRLRQCGRKTDGEGVKFAWYGRGLELEDGVVGSWALNRGGALVIPLEVVLGNVDISGAEAELQACRRPPVSIDDEFCRGWGIASFSEKPPFG